MKFLGYKRSDGKVGTRNYVGVFATVACTNEVAAGIADKVHGAVAFTHQQGCCQTTVDLAIVTRTLKSLGKNPNLASVILIALGCEGTDVEAVAEDIRASGRRVEVLVVQEIGGAAKTTAQGVLIAQEMAREASKLQRVECDTSDIRLGLKCGSSDTTSGLAPNPTLGVAVERLVAENGAAYLGEVTEFIGAEHLLAAQAKDKATGNKIIEFVERIENRAKAIGVDMRGGQPTPGNIKGGLTTIEEKSLGAIAKIGKAVVQDVCEYGYIPTSKGVTVVDSPGREPELLTGMAAAGANVIVFTTGRGAPQGFPFVPVIKLTGNKRTWENLQDHMDMTVHELMDGTISLPEAGEMVFEKIHQVASGEATKAEISGYVRAMDIYTVGPII